MKKVSRKAYLVGCPGKDNNYLPGVQYDIREMKRYLHSDRGGQWYAHEIEVLDNPNPAQLQMLVYQTKVDYLVIYFSGHGYSDHLGYGRLNCNGGSIADESLLAGPSSRVLLINDVCRTFIGSSIGRIDSDDEQYESFTGPEDFRTMFDEAIQYSPYTRIIVHGTQPGLSAADTSSGGAFTQAFLKVCNRIHSKGEPLVLNIGQMLEHVPTVLEGKGNTQIPFLYYYGNSDALPFGIAMPKTPEVPQHIVQQQVQQEDSRQLLTGLGLLALVVLLAKSLVTNKV